MQCIPLIRWRVPLAVILITLFAACQPTDDGAGAEKSGPKPAKAPVNLSAPAIAKLANATYMGVTNESVTLTDGEWRGEPFDEGGIARPRVGLIRDFYLTGDLTGDGAAEAVALLWSNSGGSGTFDYIAVVGHNEIGAPFNLATAALGDRVRVRDAEIDGNRIVVDVVQGGPEDAACCPGQKMRRIFVLADNMLNEVSSEDLGRQSIADLAGIEWRLIRFDTEEDLPDDIVVTFVFDDNRISGKSACNRYNGSVAEGDIPGALTVLSPLANTRMACPPPIDGIERRYLESLQNVSQFGFRAGKLELMWSIADRWGTMTFETGEFSE